MVMAQRVINHSNLILEFDKAEYVLLPLAKRKYLSVLLVQVEIAVGIADRFSSLDEGCNVPLQGEGLFFLRLQSRKGGVGGGIELDRLFGISHSLLLCTRDDRLRRVERKQGGFTV